ncbi:2-amino-4-hydroxy-6-hydroxymethyldihydropteridine diphosphokinase [Jiella flava]|uniref:2-amino-4-hydroxy-6-hydroxymethyldihydropteridine pyrophosphokinase n=1 Tax=Jiella flava TaxID=2816857 RepID=A0A939FZD1_9HYPH|nr:2-amino-4-hydroxy-6-hydroxymethyldihydropteridine diphosphokinase [Jiella flava]
MRVRALVGLGGNLGDPAETMAAALRAIDARSDCRVCAVSRLFRTPPWGNTDQPAFLNACAALNTDLTPRALLDLCLATERQFKRVRSERWGPRTLDLDVLDVDGEAYHDNTLTLPHPRLTERGFVLVPLADIAPDAVIAGATVAAHLASIARDGIEALGPERDWWHERR